MDLSNVFSSLGAFWNAVAALVCLHLLLLAALYAIGFRLHLAERAARFRDWAKNEPGLAQFGLVTKLPYLAVLVVLFYFTIFTWAVRITGSVANSFGLDANVPIISVWQDTSPVTAIASIERAAPETHPTLDQVAQLEFRLLDQFRGQQPRRYDSYVGYLDRSINGTLFLYHAFLLLVVVLLTAAITLGFRRIRGHPGESRHIVGLVLLAAFIGIVCMPAARYRAEALLAERSLGEVFFVGDELQFQRDAGSGASAVTASRAAPTFETVIAELECHRYDPYAGVFRILREHWLTTVLLGDRFGIPIKGERNPAPSGPYALVLTRDDSDFAPGRHLCVYLRLHGLDRNAREVEYGQTVAASPVNRFDRDGFRDGVREWVHKNPTMKVWLCSELDGRGTCSFDGSTKINGARSGA